MKMSFGTSCLLMTFFALALLVLAGSSARAATDDRLEKKITSLNDEHREMFATGDFARLDPEMNQIQEDYEKGKWTDVQLWALFRGPFWANDPAFEDLYNKWVAAYPKSYVARFLRGAYYFRQALPNSGLNSSPKPGKPPDKAEIKRFLALSTDDNTAALALTAKPFTAYSELMALYIFAGDWVKGRDMLDRANKVDLLNVMARQQYMFELGAYGKKAADLRQLVEEIRKTGRDADDTMTSMKMFYVMLFQEARYDELDREMNELQKSYEAGKVSDETLEGYFSAVNGTAPELEDKFNAWVKACPHSYAARQARSTYFLNMAWLARGDKFIKDTSTKALEGMALYLKQAVDDSKAAVALAQKPVLAYKNLLIIAKMDGGWKARKAMLDLANVADPKNVVVREEYLAGLLPQWGGSIRQMQEFLADARQQGVPEHGLTRMSRQILRALQCDTCRGSEEFTKIGTVVTGF